MFELFDVRGRRVLVLNLPPYSSAYYFLSISFLQGRARRGGGGGCKGGPATGIHVGGKTCVDDVDVDVDVMRMDSGKV